MEFTRQEACSREFLAGKLLLRGVFAFLLLSFSGCGNFFAKKPTEVETRQILNELSVLPEDTDLTTKVPEVYTQPPKIININGKSKLFYFTRNQSAGDMAKIVKSQLGYKIDSIPSTNQLIIEVPNEKEAEGVLEFLRYADEAPIQINIDCVILERFADVTMDWETSLMIENFLGEGITLGEQRGTFDGAGNLTGLDPAFPGASLREDARSTFGLDFGYWIDKGIPGHQVRIIVDLLESRGYLKILLNPKLQTTNGNKAEIKARDNVPIQKIVTGRNADPYSITEYTWVEDSLLVIPHVYSDGSIGLDTKVKIGSRSKPEGVVQTSIITDRSVEIGENRILPGEALIIGGFRKAESRSVIRGVPFFKDLPVIGAIFSSKDYEEKATELIFILIPSISTGGQDYAETLDDINKKYAKPELKPEFSELITDPLTGSVYTGHVERKAIEEETEKLKAQMQAEEAERRAEEMKQEIELQKAEAQKLEAELEKIRADASKAAAEKQKALAEAQKAKSSAEQANAEAQRAKAQAQQASAEAKKISAQADKTKAEAQQAKAEAQKAQAEAEAARTAAKQAEAERQEALRKAQEAAKEAEKLREEAQEAKEKAAKEAAARAEAARKAAEAESKGKENDDSGLEEGGESAGEGSAGDSK